MSEFLDKVKVLVSKPLFKVILLGLLIRIFMIPFSLTYDANFWTVVVRNVESGYGLYQMEGYYYTPVWGYVLAFVAGVQNLLFDVGDLSVICYDLFSYLSNQDYAYSDMGISIVVLFNLKVILTISDLVTQEVEAALKAGFVPVTLGDSRLRTETAALMAVATMHTMKQIASK